MCIGYVLLLLLPECSILGPLLFLIFFNELPHINKHSDTHEDNDDTLIEVSANDKSTTASDPNPEKLQKKSMQRELLSQNGSEGMTSDAVQKKNKSLWS